MTLLFNTGVAVREEKASRRQKLFFFLCGSEPEHA